MKSSFLITPNDDCSTKKPAIMRKNFTSLTCNLFSSILPLYHKLKPNLLSALLLIFTLTATAQNKRMVSGIVKDNAGTPLQDASVTIKGTTSGVTTNQMGAFQLEVPNGRSTLVISSIGFQTQEIPL